MALGRSDPTVAERLGRGIASSGHSGGEKKPLGVTCGGKMRRREGGGCDRGGTSAALAIPGEIL